jgi:hypothetical protein
MTENIFFIQNSEAARRKAKELTEGYKSQVKYLHEERERNEAHRLEAERCRKQLEQYKAIQLVLAGSEGEVNRMLHERGAFDGRSRDLAVLIVEMKKKIVDLKRERTLYEQKSHDSLRQCADLSRQLKSVQQELLESRLARAHPVMIQQAAPAKKRGLVLNKTEVLGPQARRPDSDLSSEDVESPAKDSSPASGSGGEAAVAEQCLPDRDDLSDLPLKSCGIFLGEKRKPLIQMNHNKEGKRLKLSGSLYENFQKQERRDEKVGV